MIFTPELARAIVSGRKTQHRLKVRNSDLRAGTNEHVCRYLPERTYSVQPAGKPAIARITILTAPQIVKLRDLTFQDAKAEGFRTRGEYAGWWLAQHDRNVDATELEDMADETRYELFLERHGNTRVWRLEFTLNNDEPLFMRTVGGYTTDHRQSIDRTAEVVPFEDLKRQTDDARAREHERLLDPDIQLRNELVEAFARYEERRDRASTNANAAEWHGAVRGIRRQLAVLDRKLKAS